MSGSTRDEGSTCSFGKDATGLIYVSGEEADGCYAIVLLSCYACLSAICESSPLKSSARMSSGSMPKISGSISLAMRRELG